MAFARVALFPGGTEEQHRALVEQLGEAYDHAGGRFVFLSGTVPDGYEIVQFWQSRAQLDAWVAGHLNDAIARLGGRGYPNPPRITDFEIDDLLLDPAAAAV